MTTKNLGFDLGFFNNRLNASADFYIRDTKGILMASKDLPSVYGASSPNSNAASIQVRGYELAISWNDQFQLLGSPFRYSISAGLGDYTGEVTEYNNDDKRLGTPYKGQKLGELWGYVIDGFFATDEEAAAYTSKVDCSLLGDRIEISTGEPGWRAGDVRIVDMDGNGKIESTQSADDIKDQVVIGNEFGGVIFHEACGHSLEATSVAPGTSEFSGKLGQKIASELVTAVDDATIPNAWGSINIDDEGTLTQRKVLIENGVLKNYMVDKFGGRRMGMSSNGASRRENYKFVPTSRMSNTFILNGKSTEEEIIAATPYGLYAKKMSGGSVYTATGEFNFSVDEAYLIENGKIGKQIKGAKLIGHGADILPNIDMVGNNMAYACSVCGSISGHIPTTVGQPAIRVKELTVGGQK